MAEFVVLNGVATGTVFVLGDVPAVVGRSPEAHLRIGDPWISSMHALFERREDALWVVDLESRNGVFLGEERVSEARVPDGAVVRLGRTEIRYTAGHARQDQIPRPAATASRPQAPRDTLRADAAAHVAHRHTPRAASSERSPLVEADATVLRMAVDAVGLEPLAGSALLLREALDAAAGAALEAGASVARLAGIGVLAVFGLDGAEDDVPRALAAARAARSAVREAAAGLELRAGIERGHVVAGRAGASGAELTALGPAAERAERLVALARPGEILAGAAAAEGLALRPVGAVRVGDLDLEVFRDETKSD